MPINASFQRTFQVAGQSYNTTRQVSADVAPVFSATVPAARSGQLTTRTSDTAGTLTMAAGHGFATGNRLDLYWAGGSRRGLTAGTVSGNSVPFSGGAGDNLPANLTNVTAMVPRVETVTAPGATLVALAVNCPTGGTAVFATAADAELYASVRTAASPSEVVVAADGTNPIGSGNTGAKVFLSHGQTTDQTLTGCVMYN